MFATRGNLISWYKALRGAGHRPCDALNIARRMAVNYSWHMMLDSYEHEPQWLAYLLRTAVPNYAGSDAGFVR